jgi:hypothetical protein
VLAALPAKPPATEDEAAKDIVALESTNVPKHTLLANLRNAAQKDLGAIAIDVGSDQDSSGDLAKYQADVKQIRNYCQP